MRETDDLNRNFILQQGLDAPEPAAVRRVASALMFQPRLVGLVLLVGLGSQSPVLFACLGVVLWWSALVPSLSPFDFAYNHTLGLRADAAPLRPAPMPRRFAQGMAATFAIAAAASLAADFAVVAWASQWVLLFGVAATLFSRFCLGSFVYHLIRERVMVASCTRR